MIRAKMVSIIAAITMLSACKDPNNKPTSISAKEPKPFIGTWTDKEAYHIVEISDTANKFRIRERYGLNENRGVEYFAASIHDTLTAQGKEDDFYKLQLPTFWLLADGRLLYNHGAGPDTLIKSAKPLPNVNCKYFPPENHD
jgi:hypothetical protein